MKVLIELELATAAFAAEQVVEAVTRLIHNDELREEITNVALYSTTDLFAAIWEASEEGAQYECTELGLRTYIASRIASGDLPDAQVPDSEVDNWIEDFKKWSNEAEYDHTQSNASIVRGYENGGNFN